MTQIIKEGGKTIIKIGNRIDTLSAEEFEKDIQPVLQEAGVNLEMDCTDLTFMASSGLRANKSKIFDAVKSGFSFQVYGLCS